MEQESGVSELIGAILLVSLVVMLMMVVTTVLISQPRPEKFHFGPPSLPIMQKWDSTRGIKIVCQTYKPEWRLHMDTSLIKKPFNLFGMKFRRLSTYCSKNYFSRETLITMKNSWKIIRHT